MRSWLKHFRERWANWCGDRDMELAIRQHLNLNGYFGRAAKLRNVRIVAVQRPGWVQIYRFDATARVNPESPSLSAAGEEAHVTSQLSPEERQSGRFPTAGSTASTDHQLFGLVLDDGRKRSQVRFFLNPEERRSLFLQWSSGMIQLRGAQGLGMDA